MQPKYRIEQNHTGSRCLWFVRLARTGKVLSHHADKADAERAAQRYIMEDRDFAMEGR